MNASTHVATSDGWLAGARAAAAALGLQVQLLGAGEILICLGAVSKSVHSRDELAVELRRHGCVVADPPGPMA